MAIQLYAQSLDYISNGRNGKIKILCGGVYMIGATVNVIVSGSEGSTVVNTIEHLEEKDELTFSCLFNLVGTSILINRSTR
ncbi:hypothetical protein Plhal703r1_c26g0107171 [Plasmopara halstedii]